VHRVPARADVLGQVVLENAERLKAIGQLESQDRVMNTPGYDLVEVVLRPVDAAPRALEIGHSPAEHDAFELEPLGELASLLVEPAADPGSAHLGIDAHLVTVEEIAGRVVPAPVTVAGDLVPGVRLQRLVTGEAHARA